MDHTLVLVGTCMGDGSPEYSNAWIEDLGQVRGSTSIAIGALILTSVVA